MATFLDRLRCDSDWQTDGGWIDVTDFVPCFQLWASGGLSTAALKSRYSMTTGQGNQIDTIVATRPAAPLLLLNVPAYVQWIDRICGVLTLASHYATDFDTDAKIKTALGI